MGGLTTYLRYGNEEMVRRGQLGGRPQLKILSEIRQQSAPINNKRRMLPNGNLIKELIRRGELEAANISPLGKGV